MEIKNIILKKDEDTGLWTATSGDCTSVADSRAQALNDLVELVEIKRIVEEEKEGYEKYGVNIPDRTSEFKESYKVFRDAAEGWAEREIKKEKEKLDPESVHSKFSEALEKWVEKENKSFREQEQWEESMKADCVQTCVGTHPEEYIGREVITWGYIDGRKLEGTSTTLKNLPLKEASEGEFKQWLNDNSPLELVLDTYRQEILGAIKTAYEAISSLKGGVGIELMDHKYEEKESGPSPEVHLDVDIDDALIELDYLHVHLGGGRPY